jgi:cell division protein FtsW
MKSKLGEVDWELFLVMLALVIIGLVMILSASAVSAMQMVDQARYFFYRQLTWSIIGLIGCFIATIIPFDVIKKLTPLFYAIGLLLLILVLVPFIGREASGASRWIDLGIVGFQPSAFAKLSLITTIALYLSSVELKPNQYLRHLMVALLLTFAYAFLVAIEPDLGTATQLGIISLCMLFLAGFPISYLMSVGLMGVPVVALTIFTSGYQTERVMAYLNPWSHPYGKGYHIIQSMKALARGGMSGLGMGESIAKRGYLPEPYTDSIVAVMGEELGLIGVSFLILLIVYLIYKGFAISMKSRDPFKKMVGAGLSAMIGIKVILNLSVVTGLVPTTGVAMPFISYGGSALLVNMISVGLLLNISRGATHV